MKEQIKFTVVSSLNIFAVLIYNLVALPHAAAQSTTTQPATTTLTPATSSTGQKSSFTLPAGATSGGSGGGASNAGNSSGAQQIIGAGINVAFGAAMMPKCTSSDPSAPMFCMMAASAAMQAISSMGSGGGAKQAGASMGAAGATGYDFGASASPTDTGGLGGLYNNDGTLKSGTTAQTTNAPGAVPQSLQTALENLRSDLKKSGTKISKDGGTFTLPDGKTVPAGASASQLASAGFSPSQIEAATAYAQTVSDKLSKLHATSMAGADGGGGGGGGAGRAPAAEDGGGGLHMRMPWDKNGKNGRNKASVSGMSKKLGSDNIGVAGDNIFEMVTRRYKSRDAQNGFIK